MDDLVKRLLREHPRFTTPCGPSEYANPDGPEAVSRIEALQRRVAELEEALKETASDCVAELEAMRAMNEVPRDGTPVLVKIKNDLSPFGIEPGSFGNTHLFCGLFAVMRNRGDMMDWCFAAPVGRGGFPDEWLDGWWPLPRAATIRALAEKETT